MKKHIFSLALLFLTFLTFAQRPGGMPAGAGNSGGKMPAITGRIFGKVVDPTTKKPVEFASVVVLRPLGRRDSIVGGMLTLENGEFSVENLPIGGIKVKISQLGYKDFVKTLALFPPDNIEVDMGDLKLEVDTKVLNEVEITAQKAQMQLNLDKKVFNVDKNITSAGGTAEDVMKNVPSVTVDADGGVKLRNTTTTIYVDGRPTLMSLNQIPADQIESVEVISNPSAKFEAQTSGGIVNIVLKKNRKPGYNGFISAGVGTQNRYNGTLNLNVKEGRVSFTGFYNVNAQGNPTDGYTYRDNLSGQRIFTQNTITTLNNLFQIARIGVDYSVNNRNTLTLAGTYVNGRFNFNSEQDYDNNLESRADSLAKGVRTIRPQNEFKNYQAQLLWRRTYPKKGKELTADLTYGWGSSSNAANWVTTGLDRSGKALPNFPELVKIEGGNIGQQLTFQLDYVNPINDSTKVEWGVRSFWNDRAQDYLFNVGINGGASYLLIPQLSQDADITDMVNAAYFTYTSKWKGIGYQAGLRFEQSKLEGVSKLNEQPPFGFNFPKGTEDIFKALFPSLYLSKKIDKQNEVQLNFSRKINRPNFMQLMPVIMNNDRNNIRIGNPALQPEFINLAEFNFNRLWKSNNWLASIYLRNEENSIVTVARPLTSDPSILVTTFENGDASWRYGLDNTLKTQLFKDFDLTTNLNVYRIQVKTPDFSNEGWAADAKFNFNYKLPNKLKDFSLQYNFNVESDQVIPQGYRKGIYFMDFAVKYTFMRVANVTFTVNDITNTRRQILVVNQPGFVQESMRRRDMRFFRVTFQMPFGKMDASIFRRAKDAQRMRGNNQNQEMDFGS